jgi:hypothetical protein
MRRAFSVASSVFRMAGLLALAGCLSLAPAALGQRGGGHAGGFGGGHAGGFGGGFSGHSFGGFSSHSFGGGYSGSIGRSPSFGSFSGARGYSYAPRMTYSAPARGFATPARPGYGIADRSRSGGYGPDRYRSPYRGYGYGTYPGNSWYVLPWELGYPDFYGYGDSSWVGQSDDAGPEQGGNYQDQGYAAAPPEDYRLTYGDPGGPAVAAAPLADEPALTLIFNDGHQQSIRNYALTSNYLLVLDDAGSGRQQRISLSDLNLPATEHAAQAAGLDFTPPPSSAPAAF